jgi:hypothetical protein
MGNNATTITTNKDIAAKAANKTYQKFNIL